MAYGRWSVTPGDCGCGCHGAPGGCGSKAKKNPLGRSPSQGAPIGAAAAVIAVAIALGVGLDMITARRRA